MPDKPHKVARLSDLKPGQLRQVEVRGTKLLLVQLDGRVYALGGTCPHYGAPLAEGTLCDGRLYCPWHQSVFDIRTGDALEPPTLDGLQRFNVSIDHGAVYVELPASVPERRQMPMCYPTPRKDERLFAIIGAGAAASTAVETLRQANYRGRIVMISPENHLPYDRPNCSKGYLAGKQTGNDMPLRPSAFYDEHGIERMQAEVTGLDVKRRQLRFRKQMPLTADKILIATGGAPVPLGVPGADLRFVYLLRSWDDSQTIRKAAANAKHAVVVGSSFIGMEVAAALSEHDLSVTVVAREEVPFVKVFGEEVGRGIQHFHTNHGTKFQLGRQVRRFVGKEERVGSVELDDGTMLKADLVVIGIGVRPVTDFVRNVTRNEDGSLDVDEHLRVAEGVYAAGDVARFPSSYLGERIRVEHWRLAQQHGRTAARNMAGQAETFTGVPFFWTHHFGESIGYVGHAPSFDEVIVSGNVRKLKFTALYARKDKLLAAAGTDSDALNTFAEQMRLGKLPAAAEVRQQGSFRLAA